MILSTMLRVSTKPILHASPTYVLQRKPQNPMDTQFNSPKQQQTLSSLNSIPGHQAHSTLTNSPPALCWANM